MFSMEWQIDQIVPWPLWCDLRGAKHLTWKVQGQLVICSKPRLRISRLNFLREQIMSKMLNCICQVIQADSLKCVAWDNVFSVNYLHSHMIIFLMVVQHFIWNWTIVFILFLWTLLSSQETVTESNNIVSLIEREAGYWVSYLIGG